ncbi:MAG: LamG domain-containing protein [Verrucomicrobia bacterium]|nr:LamG domain-containing protein [Verrucomicrobiota bacterium]
MKTKIPLLNNWTYHPFSFGRSASRKGRFPIRSGLTLVAVAGLSVTLAGPAQAALVGHWTLDDSANPWAETSGYRPAGTHDGMPIGTAGATVWSAEGHAGGHTGGSLDLTAGGCGLRIMNTSQTLDATGYQPTFDDSLANGMTIAFWAKGFPDTWAPWVSKNGETLGYYVRRAGSENFATFSLRGTASGNGDPWSTSITVNSSGNSWHHYGAVWDAVNGTRQLFVDGVLSISITGDFGPYGVANNFCLAFGARDWEGGQGGNFLSWTKCKMDDVRFYDAPLSTAEVQALAAQEAGTVVLYPQWMETLPGQKTLFSVTLVPQALQSGSVTVWVTNSSPVSVAIPGAVGNVLTLAFAQGSTNVQTFQAISAAPGTVHLTCGTSDSAAGNVATLQVDTPLPPALVAHWTFGDSANPYVETSGYRPAGTHDGAAQGTVALSTDIPAGTTGNSLDLTQGGAVKIANSSSGDSGYLPTFDDVLTSQMTIAFWVKIAQRMGSWDNFIAKNGENGGFQVRLNDVNPEACFTVRGTDGAGDVAGGVIVNDGQWHHIAAVRNGLTGLRMMYVDGYPDQRSVRPTSDTGLMQPASSDSLVLGPFTAWGRQFNGYLKDVRVYNYALSRAQVQALLPSLPTPMAGHWTFDASAPWADSSGSKPAGTHDLLPVGTVTFSTDLPPDRTGQSLDLTADGSAVVVSNSNQQMGGAGGGDPWTANPTWENTFDQGLSVQMSISFWAKGFPNAGNPWVAKKGTDFGYQVARCGAGNFATFTQTGTPGIDSPAGTMLNVNDNAWHHYAAVWDGIAGTRQLYVDGTLDPGVNLTGDYGPSSNIASFEYLVLGGRDLGGLGSYTPCLLNDVRIYRIALSQTEVLALLPTSPTPKLASRNAAASGLRIAWPVESFGYRLLTAASPTGPWSDAGLTVAVEGNERAAYAPVASSARFFRLVK